MLPIIDKIIVFCIGILIVLPLVTSVYFIIEVFIWKTKLSAHNARLQYLKNIIKECEKEEVYYKHVLKIFSSWYYRQLNSGIPLEKVLRRWEVIKQYYPERI